MANEKLCLTESAEHPGHRGRMRRKFDGFGSDIFDTYELLEMLLYKVIGYKDTNPIAKRLLLTFGSLDGVLSAEPNALAAVDGVGKKTAEFLNLVGRVPEILRIESPVEGGISDYDAAGAFFVNYFHGENGYKTSMLLLDNDMIPITIIDLYDKDLKSAGVSVRPFVVEAVKAQAAVAIIAHTHPFGPTFPAEGDIVTAKMIGEALADVEVKVAEQYVVCGEQCLGYGERLRSEDGFIGVMLKDKLRTYAVIPGEEPMLKFCSVEPLQADVMRVSELLYPVSREESFGNAKLLYAKFRSLKRTFSAPLAILKETVGEQAALYLKLLARITSVRYTEGFVFGRGHTYAEISDYFKFRFLGESVERLYLMCLDGGGRVKACELASQGTVNSVGVITRKLIEIAVKQNAEQVILAHNHPGGNTEPSSDDLRLTVVLSRVFSNVGIKLLSHLIISENDCRALTPGIDF